MERRKKARRSADQVLEHMAASVGHEMNEVLAAVMGFASVMQSKLDSDSPLASDVANILTAARRGLRITQNLLGFAHEVPDHGEQIQLNDIVGVTCGLIQQTLPPMVELELELDAELIPVNADPTQLKHLLLNLLTNAVDATSSGGSVKVSTKTVALKEQKAGGAEKLQPGRYAQIQVSDTGLGMDHETLEKACEPFFTSKDNATGLGLTTAREQIEVLGGRLQIYSRPNMGTIVTIVIPEAGIAQEQEAGAASSGKGANARPGEAILVVDDEAMVLQSTSLLLEAFGYDVFRASSGKEAIVRYEEHADEISFVLVDLIMPGMDGARVLERLLQIDPEARVVMTSGYATAKQVDAMLAAGALGFLRKPYETSELAAALTEARERASARSKSA